MKHSHDDHPAFSRVVSVHVFADGGLDWDYYLEEMLDQASVKLGGACFRRGTDNDSVLRVIQLSEVSALKIVATNIRDGITYSKLHKNNRLVFGHAVEMIFRSIGMRAADPKLVYAGIDGFGFDVSGVDGAAFFLLGERKVEPSSVVKCRFCETLYDLASDTLVVTDNDVMNTLIRSQALLVRPGLGGRRPDLLMKNTNFTESDRWEVHKRMAGIADSPHRRWSCNECSRQGMGYPGSLLAYYLPGHSSTRTVTLT